MTSYLESYEQSIADPETFWAAAAAQIHWEKKWETVLDRSAAPLGPLKLPICASRCQLLARSVHAGCSINTSAFVNLGSDSIAPTISSNLGSL